MAVWFFTPSVPELPFSGVPFTGIGLFVFAPLWVLVFVVLPWRADRGPGRVTLLAAAGAIALKVAAGLLFIPQGLVGTYECLADRDIDSLFPRPKTASDVPGYLDTVFDPIKVPVTGSPGRPWRRLDRHVDFTDNGFSLWRDNFHLLFYTYPPTTLHPKPHVRLPADPATVFSHLDFAPLRVRWTGVIRALPLPVPFGSGTRAPRGDSDGFWTVGVGGPKFWSFGAYHKRWGLAESDPAMFDSLTDRSHSSEAAQPIEVRYLRPPYPADTPRESLPTRFQLQRFWDLHASLAPLGLNVGWRELFPDWETYERCQAVSLFGVQYAEYLHWASCAVWLGMLIGPLWRLHRAWRAWTDRPVGRLQQLREAWAILRCHLSRESLRRFFTDRMILFLLSLLCFGIGAFETLRHGSRDSNWNTPDSYDYKIYLNRALVLWHHGNATPESRRPEGSGRLEWDFLGLQGDKPPPPEATLWHAPPPESVEFHPLAPIDWFVRKLAVLLDGRLGPTTYYPDEPPVLNNRLWQFHRNPLMDYWVAGLLWMFEERLGLCYLFQVMLSAAVPWLVYAIGRRTYGRGAGLAAAAVLAVDIQFTKFAYFFFAETPAAVLTALAVWAVVETRHRQRLHWYALSGLLLGLAFLMRPNLLFLLPVCAVWLFLAGRGGFREAALRGAKLTATLLVFGFLWSLMAVRNYQLIGKPLWQATSGPTVLLIGNDLPLDYPLDRYFKDIPGADAAQVRTWLLEVRRRCFDYGNTTNREVPPIGDPLHPAAYPVINPLLEQVFRDFAAENPGHILKMLWLKFWRLWGPGHKWWVVFHLIVLAAAVALLPWRRAEPWLLLACLAAVSLPLIVFFFEDRHRIPYLPLLHVFTGAVLWDLYRLGRRYSPGLARGPSDPA